MTTEEIKGGLEWAVRKGEPMKEAMMSFYNAGYDRLEIEKAASELLKTTELVPIDTARNIPPPIHGAVRRIQSSIPINQKKIVTQRQTVPSGIHSSLRRNVRPVSQYSTQMGPKKNTFVVVILVVVLLLLFSVLIGAFFFKDSIINLINNIFH